MKKRIDAELIAVIVFTVLWLGFGLAMQLCSK